MALLFLRKNLAASLTDSKLDLAGWTSETTWHETEPRSYSSLTVLLTDPLTAGQATVDVRKNGSKQTGNVVLTTSELREVARPSFVTQPGDQIDVVVTTPAGLTPTTATLLVLLE